MNRKLKDALFTAAVMLIATVLLVLLAVWIFNYNQP